MILNSKNWKILVLVCRGCLVPRKILVNEISRNDHQISMGAGLLFMRSLSLSDKMWFRKVKKISIFLSERYEKVQGVKKDDLKNWISQEPRGVESGATYHHSIHIHLCQMTSNFKISRDKKFWRLLENLPREGKFELRLWRTISWEILAIQPYVMNGLSH